MVARRKTSPDGMGKIGGNNLGGAAENQKRREHLRKQKQLPSSYWELF